jgi:hypothetical protein
MTDRLTRSTCSWFVRTEHSWWKSRVAQARSPATSSSWVWNYEGRRHTVDNPVLLLNRKCKRLKSLLAVQRAFRKSQVPFIEPIVFLSHPQVRCCLEGSAANYVRLRDLEPAGGKPGRAGIMAAIRRRECPGLRPFPAPPLKRPVIRAFAQAMEQAGFRMIADGICWRC